MGNILHSPGWRVSLNLRSTARFYIRHGELASAYIESWYTLAHTHTHIHTYLHTHTHKTMVMAPGNQRHRV